MMEPLQVIPAAAFSCLRRGIMIGDAPAGVGYLDVGNMALLGQLHLHAAADRSELERIAQQVTDNLLWPHHIVIWAATVKADK
jgi:hypothetical protein